MADGPVEALIRRAQGAAQVYIEVAGDGVLESLRALLGAAIGQ